MSNLNIKVGIIELVWCQRKGEKKGAWALPGGGYVATEQKARAIAKRINDEVTGKLKLEKHI